MPSARTGLLAASAILVVVAALTVAGIGPLAADDAPPVPAAVTASPATTTPPVPTTPDGGIDDIANIGDDRATEPGDTAEDATADDATHGDASRDAPLGDLTGAQQAAFDAANAALVHLTNVKGTPLATRLDAVASACRGLTGARLSEALAQSCTPTMEVVELSAIYPKRCAELDDGACTRLNRRLARAVDDLVHAQRVYARALRAHVPPGACRSVLLPTGRELRRASAFADAIRAVADAIEGGDRDTIIAAAAAADTASSRFGRDDHAAPAIVAEYRKACAL